MTVNSSSDEDSCSGPSSPVELIEMDLSAPQHRRPLWVGLTLSAITPVLLPVVCLLIASFFEPGALLIALAVGMIGLIISVGATVIFALPFVLVLRRHGCLSGILICALAALAGAVAYGCAVINLNWYSQLPDNSEALRKGIAAMLPGAVFGLLSGLAMSWGSGIPFFPKARRPGPTGGA